MCDTLVAVPPWTKDGAVWLAKNSDREPGEAQLVEHHLARPGGARLRATHVELGDAAAHEVVLSRPAWMWGAEMGMNARGVAIGNEAVFTRLPVAERGLLGMDLLRLALERAASAREALDVITALLACEGQGGRAGYRARSFRYHNTFVVADPSEAWVLETADRFWAAERVTGVRTVSNVLSIGAGFDLLGPGTFERARDAGWCTSARDFDFARCFGDPTFAVLSGGRPRSACTRAQLEAHRGGIDRALLARALRSHAGRDVSDGLVLTMPCAHASWQPTRHGGQTTGSMIARLDRDRSAAWLTGTSSPCLSVLKPVVLGHERPLELGPPAGAGYDAESLFWRHERLHRAVLESWSTRAPLVEIEREALEARVLSDVDHLFERRATNDVISPVVEATWRAHRDALPAWAARVEAAPVPALARVGPFALWWARQRRLDGMPASPR
ncbi:C69 family dipeptidase [Myxococcota bacterium]|nr:C69 family dipeptidase [Myxococcota bacterium]